jgi:hypothetical protein
MSPEEPIGVTLNLEQLPKNRSSVQVPLIASHFFVLENTGEERLPSLLLGEECTSRGPGGEDRATPRGG